MDGTLGGRSPVRQWVPLPVAARRLGLRWDATIELVRSRELEGRLCAGCRWFVRADSIRAYRSARAIRRAA